MDFGIFKSIAFLYSIKYYKLKLQIYDVFVKHYLRTFLDRCFQTFYGITHFSILVTDYNVRDLFFNKRLKILCDPLKIYNINP